MRRPIFLLTVVSLGLFTAGLQLHRSEAKPLDVQAVNAAPGGITLLPGYHAVQRPGPDTSEGRIARAKGLTIDYNLTCETGSYVDIARRDVKLLWSREQQVDGQPVQIAMTTNKILYVSYPRTRANFWTKVKSDQDLTDALLMLLTYRGPAVEK
jgi:hypothetical protein